MSRVTLRPVVLRGLPAGRGEPTVHTSPDVRLDGGAGATGSLICHDSEQGVRQLELRPPGTVATCRRCVEELAMIERAAKRLRGAGGNGGLV